MITLINFTHPITDEQKAQIENIVNEPVHIIDVKTQLDNDIPFGPQATALVDQAVEALGGPEAIQTTPIIVNLPGLAAAAAAVLAELHGRMGYFPPIVRLRPVPGPVRRFEVAEILDLQGLRETARTRR